MESDAIGGDRMIIRWRDYLVKVCRIETHGQEMIRFSDCHAYDKNDRSTYFPYLLLRPGEFEVLSASKAELKALERLKERLKPVKITIGKAKPKRPRQYTWVVRLKPDEFCEIGEIKSLKAYYSYPIESTSPLGIFRRVVSASREAKVISHNLEEWILKCVSPRPPNRVVAEIMLPDGETWRHRVEIRGVRPSWLE